MADQRSQVEYQGESQISDEQVLENLNEQNSTESLGLDTDMLTNDEEKQATEAIDNKYGVSLFTNSEDKYTLYDYNTITSELYGNEKNYTIEVDTRQLDNYFTEPVVYNVTGSSSTINYQSLVVIILAIQLCIVFYFGYKIISAKRFKKRRKLMN